jgi:hypothetical protein
MTTRSENESHSVHRPRTRIRPIWREVIGVVRHVRHYGLVREPANLQVYAAGATSGLVRQSPAGHDAVRRTPLEPEQLAASIRQAVSGIDRDVPVFSVRPSGTHAHRRPSSRGST